MRAGLTVNGKKSTFLYGDGDLYAEFDETGADVTRYIWGYGLGYQGKLYGVHRDEQLSTGWITGGEGGPENAYEYDAFGVLLDEILQTVKDRQLNIVIELDDLKEIF